MLKAEKNPVGERKKNKAKIHSFFYDTMSDVTSGVYSCRRSGSIRGSIAGSKQFSSGSCPPLHTALHKHYLFYVCEEPPRSRSFILYVLSVIYLFIYFIDT